MNRRTELKLENAKIFAKKYIFSGRFKVRNTLALLTVATMVGTTALAINAAGEEKNSDKTVVDIVAESVEEGNEGGYVITLSDDSYIEDTSVNTLYSRFEDRDVVIAGANVTSLSNSEYDMTGKFIVTTEGLNMRKEASEDANILTVLNTGDYGDVLETGDDWTFVAFGDNQGYLKTDYIIMDAEASKVAEEAYKDGKSYRDVIGVEEIVPQEDANVEQIVEMEETDTTAEQTAPQATEQTTQQTVTEAPAATEAPTEAATEAPAVTEAPTEAPTEVATEAPAATTDVSTSDLYLLAAVVYSEAGSECYEGQLAVASVVMNRLHNGYWGSTLSSVIYAPYQFTGTQTHYFTTALSTGGSASCLQAAQEALNGANNIGSCMYFRPTWNIDTSTLSSYTQIGNHIFY